MLKSHKAILAAMLGSAAVLGGANIAVFIDKPHAPVTSKAETARQQLASKNTQYNCYILGGCSHQPYALDDPRGIRLELAEGYVHDDLIEGCEGDWNDPFCDIVRHYQQIRIDLQASR